MYSDSSAFTRLATAVVEGTGPHCHALHSRGSPVVLSQCGIGQGGRVGRSMWRGRKEGRRTFNVESSSAINRCCPLTIN